MKRKLAFVLAGGGARGALQVGALQALLEAGLYPNLLVGTSIGAVNAAFLALRGFTKDSLEELTSVWREAARANFLPANYLWLNVRVLFGRPATDHVDRLQDYLVAHGLTPELRFGDLKHPRVIVVAADLNAGQPVLYGQNPNDRVLEGVLASTALPPWMLPLSKNGQLLVDGGTVSNLPIEPALRAGATKIIALDLADARDVQAQDAGIGPFLGKLIYTLGQRQQELELALASARGIPVTHIPLQGNVCVPLWDFRYTDELISQGYQIARQHLEEPRAGLWLERILDWWRDKRRVEATTY